MSNEPQQFFSTGLQITDPFECNFSLIKTEKNNGRDSS